MLEVVSSQTKEEIAKNRAADRVRYELCELVANLLRVLRGAGNPEDIPRLFNKCTEAMVKHESVGGIWKEIGIRKALDISQPDHDELHDGIEKMVKGATQIIASRLLGQNTQESAGRSELMEGFYRVENWRKELRAEHKRAERQFRRQHGGKSPIEVWREQNPGFDNEWDQWLATNSPPTTPEQQANGDERASPSTKGERQ